LDPNAPNDAPMTAAEAEDDVRSWFRENVGNLVFGTVVFSLILWYLHPLDVALAAAGLTLIIFIHELGHFAAAKLCKVRVETFSIGFGPAIPFCKYKYGETTYKLAVVPLGGFVKMLGEGENTEGEEAENDPRSFKNQSVPERMLIISAGVIMNILLAMTLFVIVYMHGLQEQPAVIANLEPGGALWRQGVHSGSDIARIGNHGRLWFDDVRPVVWSTDAGEKLEIELDDNGKKSVINVEPRQEPGAPFPLLGFAPPTSLTLFNHPRDKSPPFGVGSAASKATSANGGPGFLAGDTIIAMTDPSKPESMTPLAGEFPSFDFERRMTRLAGTPVMVEVRRKGGSEPVVLAIPAEFRFETGLRMRMGTIVAVRDGTPAEGKVQDGDRIVEVEVKNAEGTVTKYVTDSTAEMAKSQTDSKTTLIPLDPLRLPWLLHRWANSINSGSVKLTLLRNVGHSEKRVVVDLPWDRRSAADITNEGAATTPVAINGLGIAYQVQAVIDGVAPGSVAATAGMAPGDSVEAVKFITKDDDGNEKTSRWEDMKPGQWAYVDRVLQHREPHTIEVRINRNGQKIETKIAATADPSCPVIDRGLSFMPEYRIQKAADVGEALGMGVTRTVRMVKSMYINLYAMLFGRVSAIQTMSGPITLGRLAYKIAGESNYKLLLLLALISINLAVVNFLPIPMLDGGHMMFLIYEGIVGRPPPDRVHFWLSMLGLVCVLSLMAFVIGLDIWRLIKMWLGW